MCSNGPMKTLTYDQGLGTQQPWQKVPCQIEVAENAQKY